MNKKFMTVQGEIKAEQMGITLPHEHLLVDVRNWMHPLPQELSLRHLVSQPITIENRGEVVYRNFYFQDNLFQIDVNIAIEEAKKFKEAGGSTIVDLTLKGIGRDPEALYKISVGTGLNIIMGSGNYVISSWSEADMKRTEKQLSEEIINEFTYGVGDMRIKPGIIGEVGVSDINNPIDIKNLRASASAQNELGCSMNIHCPDYEKIGHKILDVLEHEKEKLSKYITMCCIF